MYLILSLLSETFLKYKHITNELKFVFSSYTQKYFCILPIIQNNNVYKNNQQN